MDQFQAFNPDSSMGFGDYYDAREDPRIATTINKYGGRVNYCATQPHPPHAGCQTGGRDNRVPSDPRHAWDTTDDYDFQYQDAVNYQHTAACVGPHRGVKDTRRPPMRPAWGSEQMTASPEAQGELLCLPSLPELNTSQLFWMFIVVVVVSMLINITTALHLRSLSHEIRRGRGMFTGGQDPSTW